MPGFELYGSEERAAILEWFDSNNGIMFAHGFDGLRKGVFKVREFERVVAQRVGASHALAVTSGSTALLVALRSLGIKRGDEVITSAFTFVATVEAIIESGATPVIAEIDDTFNIDPADIERRITPRTRCIVPVHMAGAPADMDAIMAIAKRHGILVLEDAAQAFDGTYNGKRLGTIGDMGTYSFDFGKNVAIGEGGMVVTNSPDLFENARAYHDHGHEYNPNYPRALDTRSKPGFNFRMTEVQGVLGLTQMKKLDFIMSTQRANKQVMKQALAAGGIKFRRLTDPAGDIGDTLIFCLEDEAQATKVVADLAAKGVGTKNLPDALTWHYAGTWQHLFGDFPHLADCHKLWPVTDHILRSAIALPVMVRMTPERLRFVHEAVLEACGYLAASATK